MLLLTTHTALIGQDAGLIQSWSFEENVEQIEGGYKLVPGIKGQAIKLDGFTTCLQPDPSVLSDLSDSYTITAWIAMAAYPWNWCPVITQMTAESGGFSFDIGPRGELRLTMHCGRNWQVVLSDATVKLRQWTHIAARYESGVGLTLYIDGKPVAELKTTGKPIFAPKTDPRIGMNYDAVFPSNRIGENGITPYWFSLDGIIDELKVFNKALPDETLLTAFTVVDQGGLPEPAIHARHLPRAQETGQFQAYYTHLTYYPEWDEQWPVGPDPDIVVTFENSPVQLIFWRGTRYSPAWVTDNNQWMCDQSVETWNGEEGCKEHMQDRHCKYSHVRLIENTPARKVIHWRYAPVSAYDTHWVVNEKTGWEVWIDEYYYIYPDATGIRKVSWKTDYFGRPRQFQETLPLTGPGQTRRDIMEVDYLTIANQAGDQMQLVYCDNPRKEKDLDIIDGPNIQQHNFKSEYDPFIIFEPGNRMHYIMDRDIGNLDHPGSCNHWPVGQAYCDGRVSQANDRPAHFLGFPISDPIIHDLENGRSYWAGLYGMKKSDMKNLIELARSWNNPPELDTKTDGLVSEGYKRDEKCFVIIHPVGKKEILFQWEATSEKPLVNPSIRIHDWPSESLQLYVNGQLLQEGVEYWSGYTQHLEGNDLVITINNIYSNQTALKVLVPAR